MVIKFHSKQETTRHLLVYEGSITGQIVGDIWNIEVVFHIPTYFDRIPLYSFIFWIIPLYIHKYKEKIVILQSIGII